MHLIPVNSRDWLMNKWRTIFCRHSLSVSQFYDKACPKRFPRANNGNTINIYLFHLIFQNMFFNIRFHFLQILYFMKIDPNFISTSKTFYLKILINVNYRCDLVKSGIIHSDHLTGLYCFKNHNVSVLNNGWLAIARNKSDKSRDNE